MLNDPHSYTNPIEFRPERFLVHDGQQPEQDPHTISFGFGRRSVSCEVDIMYRTHSCSVSVQVGASLAVILV